MKKTQRNKTKIKVKSKKLTLKPKKKLKKTSQIPKIQLPSKPKTPVKFTDVELTKKGTIRKRKPKTSNVYFTEDTENAIIEYVNSTDQDFRNKVYNERIDYAFHKLAENIIHTFKFYYTDMDTMAELRHEVVAFLLSKLHLYKKDKGKAYSYFGTIAKRYLIIYNEKNYSKLKERAELEEVDEDKKIFSEIVQEGEKDHLPTFIDLFIQYVDKHLFKLFPKQQDNKTADAIMELFRKRENLDVFNKKALFIYTREMTEVTTPQITKVIKKLKNYYQILYNLYDKNGDIDMNYEIV